MNFEASPPLSYEFSDKTPNVEEGEDDSKYSPEYLDTDTIPVTSSLEAIIAPEAVTSSSEAISDFSPDTESFFRFIHILPEDIVKGPNKHTTRMKQLILTHRSYMSEYTEDKLARLCEKHSHEMEKDEVRFNLVKKQPFVFRGQNPQIITRVHGNFIYLYSSLRTHEERKHHFYRYNTVQEKLEIIRPRIEGDKAYDGDFHIHTFTTDAWYDGILNNDIELRRYHDGEWYTLSTKEATTIVSCPSRSEEKKYSDVLGYNLPYQRFFVKGILYFFIRGKKYTEIYHAASLHRILVMKEVIFDIFVEGNELYALSRRHIRVYDIL